MFEGTINVFPVGKKFPLAIKIQRLWTLPFWSYYWIWQLKDRFTAKRSSPNFVSNIKANLRELINFYSLWIYEKEEELINSFKFALVLKKKFREDP